MLKGRRSGELRTNATRRKTNETKTLGKPKKCQDVTSVIQVLEGLRKEYRFETALMIEFPDEGIEFTFDDNDRLIGIHLFSALEEKTKYSRGIPFGVQCGDNRQTVCQKLGRSPDHSGDGNVWNGKIVPLWDSYEIDRGIIHLQYSRVDQGVELVTLMASTEEVPPTRVEIVRPKEKDN